MDPRLALFQRRPPATTGGRMAGRVAPPQGGTVTGPNLPKPLAPHPLAVLNQGEVSYLDVCKVMEGALDAGQLPTAGKLFAAGGLSNMEAIREHSRWMTLRDPRIFLVGTRFTLGVDIEEPDLDFEDASPRVARAGAVWEIGEVLPKQEGIATYSAECDEAGFRATFNHESLEALGFQFLVLTEDLEASYTGKDSSEVRVAILEERVKALEMMNTLVLKDFAAGVAGLLDAAEAEVSTPEVLAEIRNLRGICEDILKEPQ